jgi:hypothetical protein
LFLPFRSDGDRPFLDEEGGDEGRRVRAGPECERRGGVCEDFDRVGNGGSRFDDLGLEKTGQYSTTEGE